MMRQGPLRVQHTGDHRSVVTTENVAMGAVVGPLEVERVTHAQQYSLQLGEDEHGVGLGDFTWLNHSCDPNVFVDTTRREVTALHAIAAGTELTFFYPSTEWRMREAFGCHCASARCVGRIEGAASLPVHVLQRYRLNLHILKLLRTSTTHPSFHGWVIP